MNKAIEIFKALSALLPIALQLIRQIEEAVPESGRGAEKLAAVREVLSRVFASVSGVTVTFEQLWPTLQALINSAVAAFNALGTFKKSAPKA